LLGYSYDAVVLDIMGVNGFQLLKRSVERGFPTVMLTAHALTPEALKKSITLGAVSFLPKEQIGEIRAHLSLSDIHESINELKYYREKVFLP
jgi:DNA-binding response OmpR family regulator